MSHVLVTPTITGRCILVVYKVRWILFPLILLASWLALIVICELRMRESGLRNRMSLAAEMLMGKSTIVTPESLENVVQNYGASFQATSHGSAEQNKQTLFRKLQKWYSSDKDIRPTRQLNELAIFLSPETNDRKGELPPVFFKNSSDKGDYAKYGIDLRVNRSGDIKKEDVTDDALWFQRVSEHWSEMSKDSWWFVSDTNTPRWPADEFKFYDFKRDRLNRMIIYGLAASLGILSVLVGARLSGFDPPTWKQIIGQRKFMLTAEGRPRTPLNCDCSIVQTKNVWLWSILVIVTIIQYCQFNERKELWAEGWINHPVSFIVILSFGMALAVASRPLQPSKDREYFLEDYLNHFRQHNWCLLCIPLSAFCVIVYSLWVLMPSDPIRALIQIGISMAFLLATAFCLRTMARSASKIECRENKDADHAEPIQLWKHKYLLFCPKLDHKLPAQLLIMLATLLAGLTLGGF